MRAADLHMAATVNPRRRQVLLTGAIDQNDEDLIMRIKLPSPGVWTFYKAETNLTQDPWAGWLISLGNGFTIPKNESDRFVECRQFKHCSYEEEYGGILFMDGEVRPGEPILKVFSIEIEDNGGDMSIGSAAHSRLTGKIDLESIRAAIGKGFGEKRPKIEIEVPIRIID